MTTPRTRQPSAQQRADALMIAASARPSGKSVRAARQRIAQIAWEARTSGDWPTYREVMGRVRELRTRTKETGWKSPAELRAARREAPAQVQRLADSRARADQARPHVQAQQRQRDLDRFRANALAHALWALHQGHRDWTPLPTTTPDTTRPPAEDPIKRPLGAAYLDVQVPETQYGPACTLRMWRHNYEELLDLWGYHRVTRANRLRDKLRATSSSDDLTALHALALDSARHPNLAMSWHAYVTGSRLGDVFTPHQASQSMQLASGRSGDLREALNQVYAQAQVITHRAGD